MASTTASRVGDFIDSLGVNIHSQFYDTPYYDIDQVLASLQYLGIGSVRDATGYASLQLDRLAYLGENGIKLDMMVGVQGDTYANQFALVEKLAPYLRSLEGPNEVNYWEATLNGVGGIAGARAVQKLIADYVSSSAALKDVPIINFSVAASDSGSFAAYGDNSANADYGNAHIYYGGGATSYSVLSTYVPMANQMNPGQQMVITESGYPTQTSGAGNQGVSEAVQAKYTLNLLLDTYKLGYAATYLYELVDSFQDPTDTNQEAHYGLFNYDWSAKPVAVAIHNLTTILSDTGSTAESFTTGTLGYSVSGLPATGNTLLLEKSSGTYELAVWNEQKLWDSATLSEIAAKSTTVTVTLDHTFGTVKVYDPLLGTEAQSIYSNVSQLQISLTDHPLVIEMADAKSVAISPGGTTSTTDAHTITLKLSGDSWQGDAQVKVFIDGVAMGDTVTVTAQHGSGQTQDLTLSGHWDAGAHTISVQFLNDAYGGTTGTDRNAYVDQILVDGNELLTSASWLTYNRTIDYAVSLTDQLVAGKTPVTISSAVSTTLASTADNLVLTGSAALKGVGNALDNTITANDAGNNLYGKDGADTLNGGAGNDYLDGGTGADHMAGGLGNDIYVVDNAGDVVTEAANGGQDEVLANVDFTLPENIEQIKMTSPGISGNGNSLNNVMRGTDGSDFLSSLAGNDTIYGRGGDDKLSGGDGQDYLNGGAGADYMMGGTGNDTYVVDDINDVAIEFAHEGYDRILASVSFTLPSNIEQLNLLAEGLIGTGNELNNMLYGSNGKDVLKGMAGNDILYGFAGNDVLDGGAGNDVLSGGAGADTFLFSKSESGGRDVIADFSHIEGDAIRLLGFHIDNWAEAHAAMKQSGNDVILSLDGGQTIVFKGITVATIHINDFVFA
ncbi:carbohydrate-binding domain-containing protein [Roseomonas mucosa]|uniref:carbohydrate-binding domain-containing protein n=1 Tax=Roseomonas mucosa TaxID=207340 RepID=UPI0028CEB879|nr:carbohydrate-binding domain-containing protein [Roseomonas mucosa]MDT8316220.1 carbohydrate-binding domain-containing protein [Roseomonas mucosa]MDT8362716.1 carbohydrate-binding domain-containing protein [Roseomonas mucosa]